MPNKDVKKYWIDDHFKPGWEESEELFRKVRSKILALDARIEEHIRKQHIGYKIGESLVFRMRSFKSKIRLELIRVEKQDIHDPDDRFEFVKWEARKCLYDIPSSGDSISEDIDYAMPASKQALKIFLKKQLSKNR